MVFLFIKRFHFFIFFFLFFPSFSSGMQIQGSEHSSLEDAQATMALYRKHAKAWEKDLMQKRFGQKKKPATKSAPVGGLFA